MPDILTAEERAAIAAFPPEKVRHCARGESGIPINGYTPRDRTRIAINNARRNNTFLRSIEINAAIREYTEKGLTDQEISEKVKLTIGAVRQRRYRMHIPGKGAK